MNDKAPMTTPKHAGDQIYLRSPRSERERLDAALTSSPDDWFEDENARLVITGTNLDGERIYLGEVSMSALYQVDNPMRLIGHVLFAKPTNDRQRG